MEVKNKFIDSFFVKRNEESGIVSLFINRVSKSTYCQRRYDTTFTISEVDGFGGDDHDHFDLITQDVVDVLDPDTRYIRYENVCKGQNTFIWVPINLVSK